MVSLTNSVPLSVKIVLGAPNWKTHKIKQFKLVLADLLLTGYSLTNPVIVSEKIYTLSLLFSELSKP